MKAGKCEFCQSESDALWLVNIAQYDSLIPEDRLRVDLCEECAVKLARALESLVKPASADDRPILACPQCGHKLSTDDPKSPVPCPKCGTIFSEYSGGKRVIRGFRKR
jgi:protein-arginine kinase activator protein McsA